MRAMRSGIPCSLLSALCSLLLVACCCFREVLYILAGGIFREQGFTVECGAVHSQSVRIGMKKEEILEASAPRGATFALTRTTSRAIQKVTRPFRRLQLSHRLLDLTFSCRKIYFNTSTWQSTEKPSCVVLLRFQLTCSDHAG